MSFIRYDIALLVLFVLFVSVFLYRRRANLKKEGLLFLYKTTWGIKLIDQTAKRFPKTLKFLSYVSIGMGYVLMAGMLYLFAKIIYVYIALPDVVRIIKIPPVTPLIPYLPQAFKLDFLPPFYFIYWIVILAIVAITHEFAHGIFMRRYNIHIKSTGFGFFPFFLPIFLAAFVEQDEKSMNKAGKFQQKAVLAAGTFANILTAILFFGIMILFFSLAFNPSGVQFDNYAYDLIAIGGINSINGISFSNQTYQNLLYSIDEKNLNKLETNEGDFFITKEFLELQRGDLEYIFAYLDAPAINNELEGAILEIDGVKIENIDSLAEKLDEYSPGEGINIQTTEKNYEIALGEFPDDPSRAWLGITFEDKKPEGAFGKIIYSITSFKDPHTFYKSNFEFAGFIYNFLWWLVLISFSVALINMLPMGIFDGGRFFYLTIWQITKSEKKAKKVFGFATYLFLILLLILMFFWAFSFIGGGLFG